MIAGSALGWAKDTPSGGTQLAQLKAVPIVQQACGWSQQPIAAAAVATLELHSTVPSSQATNKRCKTQRWTKRRSKRWTKRCAFWRLCIFSIKVSLTKLGLSYKRVCLIGFASAPVGGRLRLEHGFGHAAQNVHFFFAQLGAVEQSVQARHELFGGCGVEVTQVHQGLL